MTRQPPDEAIAPVHARKVATLSEVRRMIRELPSGARVGPQAVRHLYRWMNESEEAQFFRLIPPILAYDKQRKAALREGLQRVPSSKSLRKFSAGLSEADKDVLHQLQLLYDTAMAQERRQGSGTAGRWQNDSIAKILDRIADAVDTARQLVSGTPGRQHLAGSYKGAELLKDKYEEMSRLRFTFDRERGRKGLGWVTPGARFVAAGLRAWFPNIADTQIESVMKSLSGNKNLP